MEIKGEDFIKKVQLKQEKDEIEQRLNELHNQEAQYEEIQQQAAPRSSRNVEIEEEMEYSDLRLGEGSQRNEANKKKYLILGLVLVILFLLTIIIIRLLTNDSVENDSFSKTTEQNKVLENENIEEQYQKIINEKLKNIKEEKEQNILADKQIDDKLDLKKIEEKETVEKPKKVKPDFYEVKKTKPVETKKEPVVKKQVVKQATKKVIPKKSTNGTITSKPSGTFVQVGAFTKMPSDEYLNSISKKGFNYKVYKVSINNKMFHKVLIGPYKSRGQASLNINSIKKKLNVSGAFILTF
ncbi:MAG: SPOR domain-containing protein [Halarcobacter sp.]